MSSLQQASAHKKGDEIELTDNNHIPFDTKPDEIPVLSRGFVIHGQDNHDNTHHEVQVINNRHEIHTNIAEHNLAIPYSRSIDSSLLSHTPTLYSTNGQLNDMRLSIVIEEYDGRDPTRIIASSKAALLQSYATQETRQKYRDIENALSSSRLEALKRQFDLKSPSISNTSDLSVPTTKLSLDYLERIRTNDPLNIELSSVLADLELVESQLNELCKRPFLPSASMVNSGTNKNHLETNQTLPKLTHTSNSNTHKNNNPKNTRNHFSSAHAVVQWQEKIFSPREILSYPLIDLTHVKGHSSINSNINVDNESGPSGAYDSSDIPGEVHNFLNLTPVQRVRALQRQVTKIIVPNASLESQDMDMLPPELLFDRAKDLVKMMNPVRIASYTHFDKLLEIHTPLTTSMIEGTSSGTNNTTSSIAQAVRPNIFGTSYNDLDNPIALSSQDESKKFENNISFYVTANIGACTVVESGTCNSLVQARQAGFEVVLCRIRALPSTGLGAGVSGHQWGDSTLTTTTTLPSFGPKHSAPIETDMIESSLVSQLSSDQTPISSFDSIPPLLFPNQIYSESHSTSEFQAQDTTKLSTVQQEDGSWYLFQTPDCRYWRYKIRILDKNSPSDHQHQTLQDSEKSDILFQQNTNTLSDANTNANAAIPNSLGGLGTQWGASEYEKATNFPSHPNVELMLPLPSIVSSNVFDPLATSQQHINKSLVGIQTQLSALLERASDLFIKIQTQSRMIRHRNLETPSDSTKSLQKKALLTLGSNLASPTGSTGGNETTEEDKLINDLQNSSDLLVEVRKQIYNLLVSLRKTILRKESQHKASTRRALDFLLRKRLAGQHCVRPIPMSDQSLLDLSGKRNFQHLYSDPSQSPKGGMGKKLMRYTICGSIDRCEGFENDKIYVEYHIFAPSRYWSIDSTTPHSKTRLSAITHTAFGEFLGPKTSGSTISARNTSGWKSGSFNGNGLGLFVSSENAARWDDPKPKSAIHQSSAPGYPEMTPDHLEPGKSEIYAGFHPFQNSSDNQNTSYFGKGYDCGLLALLGFGASSADYCPTHAIAHPIEVDLLHVYNDTQSYPTLLQPVTIAATVYSVDLFGSHTVVGSGFSHFPSAGGSYQIQIQTYKPSGTLREEVQSWFLGGGPRIADLQFVTVPSYDALREANNVGLAGLWQDDLYNRLAVKDHLVEDDVYEVLRKTSRLPINSRGPGRGPKRESTNQPIRLRDNGDTQEFQFDSDDEDDALGENYPGSILHRRKVDQLHPLGYLRGKSVDKRRSLLNEKDRLNEDPQSYTHRLLQEKRGSDSSDNDDDDDDGGGDGDTTHGHGDDIVGKQLHTKRKQALAWTSVLLRHQRKQADEQDKAMKRTSTRGVDSSDEDEDDIISHKIASAGLASNIDLPQHIGSSMFLNRRGLTTQPAGQILLNLNVFLTIPPSTTEERHI